MNWSDWTTETITLVRLLTFEQLQMLLEVLTQYEQNQGEHEECEAGREDFVPSDNLRNCRELLGACVLEHHRRLGVELPAELP